MGDAKEQLSNKLADWRAGRLSADEMARWVRSNKGIISPLIVRGLLLKLMAGVIAPVSANVLPSCVRCSSICKEGPFADRSEFEKCADEIGLAVKRSDLQPMAEPAWAPSSSKELGGAAFYSCSSCGAVWKILLPERAQSGEWRRIA